MKRHLDMSETSAVIEVDQARAEGPRVYIRGDVDFRSAPGMREELQELLGKGHKRIYLHLHDIIFIGSSGISTLLDAAKLARELGVDLILVSPTRQIMHLVDIAGLKSLFKVEHPPVVKEDIPTSPHVPPKCVRWQLNEFVVPCDPALVADIRRRVGQIANSMPFSDEEVEDIKLAVGEAAANAYRYGCPDGDNSVIRVRCEGKHSGLCVEISDSGKGFDPACVPELQQGSLECGGRGIFFMKLTMDKVEFIKQKKGTMVRMFKKLRGGEGEMG